MQMMPRQPVSASDLARIDYARIVELESRIADIAEQLGFCVTRFSVAEEDLNGRPVVKIRMRQLRSRG